MPNPQTTQQGIETRKTIVDLVALDQAEGGDGLTRAQLGVSKTVIVKHMKTPLADNRVKQVKDRGLPADAEHVHICRTCGASFH